MNEENESFEKRLKRQPLRQVPAEWREDILRVAGESQSVRRSSTAAEYSFLSSLNRRLASVLWPHPVAWAALAAIWIFVFTVNYSIQDTQPVVAEKVAPASPEVRAELRQQQRLFAELAGASDSEDADRQRTYVPRPHSERGGWSTA
jgi:hypothetical protein